MTSQSDDRKPRILYVEDEVIVALDVADSLKYDYGFDVAVAHNLRTANVLAQSQDFDFALLDVNLGNNERSCELGQTLRDRGVTVVFASGYESKAISELDGFTVIEKPFLVSDVGAALQASAA